MRLGNYSIFLICQPIFAIELVDSFTHQVPVAERAAESPIDGMYNFAHKSFYVETMKGYTFVLYMQGAGRDSEKAEITWKKVAKYFELNKNVKIGQVITFSEIFCMKLNCKYICR